MFIPSKVVEASIHTQPRFGIILDLRGFLNSTIRFNEEFVERPALFMRHMESIMAVAGVTNWKDVEGSMMEVESDGGALVVALRNMTDPTIRFDFSRFWTPEQRRESRGC